MTSDVSGGMSVVVGLCAAATVVRGKSSKTNAQMDIDWCNSALETVGVGPNSVIEAQVVRFISRLRANFDATVSGIMSQIAGSDISDEVDVLTDIRNAGWVDREAVALFDVVLARVAASPE